MCRRRNNWLSGRHDCARPSCICLRPMRGDAGERRRLWLFVRRFGQAMTSGAQQTEFGERATVPERREAQPRVEAALGCDCCSAATVERAEARVQAVALMASVPEAEPERIAKLVRLGAAPLARAVEARAARRRRLDSRGSDSTPGGRRGQRTQRAEQLREF